MHTYFEICILLHWHLNLPVFSLINVAGVNSMEHENQIIRSLFGPVSFKKYAEGHFPPWRGNHISPKKITWPHIHGLKFVEKVGGNYPEGHFPWVHLGFDDLLLM